MLAARPAPASDSPRDPATGPFQFDGQDVVAGCQKLHDNDRLPLALPAI
jgi:hypothetical protein